MNQPALLALAGFSLILAVGGSWFKAEAKQKGLWPKFEEQWWYATARFFYFVGLPYLAVISGFLAPRWLGLKGLENITGLAELQKGLTLWGLELFVDAGPVMWPGLMALGLLIGIRLALAQKMSSLTPTFSQLLIQIGYDGLHWAFYRAIFWRITGDLYLGVVYGVMLMLAEWSLSAWVQGHHPFRDQKQLARQIILILTATLFFHSPNLWVTWCWHGLMLAIVNAPLPQLLARPKSF
jgi:hypothetical protein